MRWQIDLCRFLDVEGEAGIGAQISVPIAPSGRAGDVDMPIDIVKPDLDPARFTAGSANRCYVNHPSMLKRVTYLLIHEFVLLIIQFWILDASLRS